MKIAIIGAGASGLAALRHSTSNNYDNEVICYEKSESVGGTWVYKEDTGVDQYGLPIHTSMYKSLRTNLPKEIMGYPDFPIPDATESFLPHTQILDFLNLYCDHFDLRQHIRFLHNVEFVKRIEGEQKWLVAAKDLQNNNITIQSFDAVMICNGHSSLPNIPKIKGHDIFHGLQMHSHDYRVPDVFANRTVVIFGAGPSGLDLTLEISKTAKLVFFSHHLTQINTAFPDNVIQKCDVKELTERTVIFEDGSSERADVIFYCTGYKYSFPFLDTSCKVQVHSNIVKPLWKHVVSIENPTLALIGVPTRTCAFNVADLQVRFVLRFWCGDKVFPSKNEMLEEVDAEIRARAKDGTPMKHFHMLHEKQDGYCENLAKIAEITTIPPVITNIYKDCSKRFFLGDFVSYRNGKYKIIDEYNFVRY